MRSSLLIAIICIFFSCHTNDQKIKSPATRKTENRIFVRDTLIDFKYFSFMAPKGWQSANDDTLPVSGDATFRRRLHNVNGKLIHFEYGLSTYGERFSPYPIPAYRRARYLDHKFDTSGWVFSDDPRLPELMEQSRYDFSALKVAGFPAFVYRPKAYGNGYSGIYIDSTEVIGGNLVEFAVYGENLDSSEIVQLRKVVNTLEIRPFK
jgi:hypothetical protein